MNETMTNFVAQGNFDWMENIYGIVVIAFVVFGNIANSIIKSIKEKKGREKELTTPMPKPPPAQQRGGEPSPFPTARPRPARPEVARPLPPTRPTSPPPPVARPAPGTQPPRPAKTLGIPRELLPEGLEEILAEVVPGLVRPKPRPQTQPPTQPPTTPTTPTTGKAASPRGRTAPPPKRSKKKVSQRPADSAERLGTLTSSFDDEKPRESSVAAHVESHISHLKHPVDDVPLGTAAHARRLPSRAALRHAVIMSEILAPPRALRPIEDRF